MARTVKLLCTVGVAILLQACAASRPPDYDVKCQGIEDGRWVVSSPDLLKQTLTVHMSRRALDANQDVAPPTRPVILVLSSGGEYGAWGGGYLQGWLEHDARALGDGKPRLADVDVVTGVSAGSILATYAFIGDAAHIKTAADLFRNLDDDQVFKQRNYLSLIRASALLATERKRDLIRSRVVPQLLNEVVDASRKNTRKLYVGTTNLDTGAFTVIDLTAMADSFVTASKEGNQPEADQAIACYRAAIDASSAIEVAFDPAFMNKTMYGDGAARWPMFMLGNPDNAMPDVDVVAFIHDPLHVDSTGTTPNGFLQIALRTMQLFMDDTMKASIRLLESKASPPGDPHGLKTFYAFAGEALERCARQTSNACGSQRFCPAFESCIADQGQDQGRKLGFTAFKDLPLGTQPPATTISRSTLLQWDPHTTVDGK